MASRMNGAASFDAKSKYHSRNMSKLPAITADVLKGKGFETDRHSMDSPNRGSVVGDSPPRRNLIKNSSKMAMTPVNIRNAALAEARFNS